MVLAAYYAGHWTVNTTTCDDIYQPLMWVLLGFFPHVAGLITLALKTRTDPNAVYVRNGWIDKLKRAGRNEITPCFAQEPLILKRSPDRLLSAFMSWFTSLLTVCYLLYGTLTFTSLAFIGKSI